MRRRELGPVRRCRARGCQVVTCRTRCPAHEAAYKMHCREERRRDRGDHFGVWTCGGCGRAGHNIGTCEGVRMGATI